MDFGPVPVRDAEGAVLAHSVHAGARRLKKGTCLSARDIAALVGAGIDTVTAARLAPGDVGEDAAALRLAEALADGGGGGLRLSGAATGRVNLHAIAPGLARIDAGAIARVNAVSPDITVATLPEWQRGAAGTMVATVKIIPYGVAGADLDRAVEAGRGALGMSVPRLARAAFVETEVAGSVRSDKGEAATRDRLARLGVAMDPGVRVPHQVAPLAEALAASDAGLILILTGSATSDIRDTGPAAVRAAGGEVVHFGMPVDPGNLLFLGRIGAQAVLGLPGCARSPALNGADWVLERLVCGVPVGPAEIAAMGVGGLLKEIPTRPRPRDH